MASSASRQYYTENGGVTKGMEDATNLDFFAGEYMLKELQLTFSRLQ